MNGLEMHVNWEMSYTEPHILAAKGKITAADLIFDLSDGVGSLNTADVLASMLHSDQENEVQL